MPTLSPNSAVPADIANALFYNSDHLPVYMEMVIEGTVGVQEVDKVLSSAYYNASDNTLNLKFKTPVSKIELEIYDLSGKRVHSITNGKEVNSVNNLYSGIYLAKVTTEKGTGTIKFVVQ